jgi:hypothetical protein
MVACRCITKFVCMVVCICRKVDERFNIVLQETKSRTEMGVLFVTVRDTFCRRNLLSSPLTEDGSEGGILPRSCLFP